MKDTGQMTLYKTSYIHRVKTTVRVWIEYTYSRLYVICYSLNVIL